MYSDPVVCQPPFTIAAPIAPPAWLRVAPPAPAAAPLPCSPYPSVSSPALAPSPSSPICTSPPAPCAASQLCPPPCRPWSPATRDAAVPFDAAAKRTLWCVCEEMADVTASSASSSSSVRAEQSAAWPVSKGQPRNKSACLEYPQISTTPRSRTWRPAPPAPATRGSHSVCRVSRRPTPLFRRRARPSLYGIASLPGEPPKPLTRPFKGRGLVKGLHKRPLSGNNCPRKQFNACLQCLGPCTDGSFRATKGSISGLHIMNQQRCLPTLLRQMIPTARHENPARHEKRALRITKQGLALCLGRPYSV